MRAPSGARVCSCHAAPARPPAYTALRMSGVHNLVGEALIKRIVRAHETGQQFRVVVCMPLFPGNHGTGPRRGGTGPRRRVHAALSG